MSKVRKMVKNTLERICLYFPVKSWPSKKNHAPPPLGLIGPRSICREIRAACVKESGLAFDRHTAYSVSYH